MNRFFVLTVTVLCSTTWSVAQQSYPMLMSIDPVAAQIGATTEHVVKSRYTMADAYEVLVSGQGVVGEAVLPEPKEGDKPAPTLQSLTLRFTVAPDAIPGVRDFRIATPTGISTTGQLVITRDVVIAESGKNDTIQEANEVTIPATICGRIERAEDIDYFRFHAEAGDRICFHVRCMRLEDRIHDLQTHADPMLSIRNAAGSTIAASDNVFAADPFLAHEFSESGDYFLELRDVRYQGNQYWCYCIQASKRPFVQTVFPLAVNRNHSDPIELVGSALAATTQGSVATAPSGASGIQQVMVSIDEETRQPVEMVVLDQAAELETDAENESVEQAHSISVPGGINGRIASEGDIDYYRFDGKKGERYSFEVIARRAGSSLDSHLRILNESGSQLQLSDDTRVGKRNVADSRIENWVVPSDGSYAIEIRDVHLRGGPSYVYYLDITRAEPHFTLFADTDKTPISPGTSGVIFVRAEKKNGFDSDIQLHVDGLPDGVTATCGRILRGKGQDGCIILTASGTTQPFATPIRIYGTAASGEEGAQRELTADATIYQEIYQPGGGRGHWPVTSHVVSLGQPADIRKVSLSNHEVVIRQGESASIDVEVERASGFDKNITLEVIYKHLNSVYGDSLPEGVTIDKSASKVLLTGGATKGTITFTAAADAPPTERQVIPVMANVSINFVMKATYAGDPVFLTVAAF